MKTFYSTCNSTDKKKKQKLNQNKKIECIFSATSALKFVAALKPSYLNSPDLIVTV